MVGARGALVLTRSVSGRAFLPGFLRPGGSSRMESGALCHCERQLSVQISFWVLSSPVS